MQVLTGRITADAKVNTVKDGKKVVNFSIAINDSYKSKSSEGVTKIVTYFNCSYWRNEAVSPYLTKGTLVELCGRTSVSAWVSRDGEPKAGLNFHTTEIKLLGKSISKNENTNDELESGENTAGDSVIIKDDLPF